MKLTLRSTLLSILLVVTLVTVGSLSLSAFYYGRRSARFLMEEALQQASANVYYQVHSLIDVADDQTLLNLQYLETGQVGVARFSELVAYWLGVMRVERDLSSITLTLEESGETISVSRSRTGHLMVQEIRRQPQTDSLILSDYQASDYPFHEQFSTSDSKRIDLRDRSWYRAAKDAQAKIWTDAYVFVGEKGLCEVPGVTCAVPVSCSNGDFAGVLAVDVDVLQLCHYLQTVDVAEGTEVFIIELREDGTRLILAMPEVSRLFREETLEDGETIGNLIPAVEIDNPRIRSFAQLLPSALDLDDGMQFVPVEFRVAGTLFVGGYRYVSGRDTPNWLICFVLPESSLMQHVWANQQVTTWIGVSILVLSLLASMKVARMVARPLEKLGHETEAIGRFDVEPRPTIRSPVLEVDRLGLAVEEMKTGLRSFQKYVPADLVRAIVTAQQEAKLGGERREVTVFFSDIAGFTSIAEAMLPERVVTQLHEYLEALSREIQHTGGTVDKYIGDGIMAFWNAPRPDALHAVAACTAALRCQQVLVKLCHHWSRQGQPLFQTRIGINTGQVVVGNFGSDARFNYTVMGDAVNLASRLEGLNKYYGTNILLGETTYEQAKADIIARPVDWVSVKGKQEAVLIYEMLGLSAETDTEVRELAELCAAALSYYRAQDWYAAVRDFEQALKIRPEDPPVQHMINRIRQYQQQPPAGDWNGVHQWITK
jgi:adenylate cyclase